MASRVAISLVAVGIEFTFAQVNVAGVLVCLPTWLAAGRSAGRPTRRTGRWLLCSPAGLNLLICNGRSTGGGGNQDDDDDGRQSPKYASKVMSSTGSIEAE